MTCIDWDSRFWSKAARPTWTDCWIWMGAKAGNGYGNVWVAGKYMAAHRHAFECVNGPLQHGDVVRHTCDTPLCCNPAHLVPGTHADNMRDKVERGRSLRGERHNMVKLTESQVTEIRAKYAAGGRTQQSIGAEYGVSVQLVSLIVRGKRWAASPGEVVANRGESNERARLTPAQVAEIRAKYAAGGRTQADVAAEYGVSGVHVSAIVRGKRWRKGEAA